MAYAACTGLACMRLAALEEAYQASCVEVGIHMADNRHNRGVAVEQPGPRSLLRRMEEAWGSGQVAACAHHVAQEGVEVVGTSACNACRCTAK